MIKKKSWFKKLNNKHWYVILLSLSLLVVSMVLVILLPSSKAADDNSDVISEYSFSYSTAEYGELIKGHIGYIPEIYEMDRESHMAKYYMYSGGISRLPDTYTTQYDMSIEMVFSEGVMVDSVDDSIYFSVSYDSSSIVFKTTDAFGGNSFPQFVLLADSTTLLSSIPLFQEIIVTITPHDGAESPIVVTFDDLDDMPHTLPASTISYVFSGDVPDVSTINASLGDPDETDSSGVFGKTDIPPGEEYYIQDITSTDTNYYIKEWHVFSAEDNSEIEVYSDGSGGYYFYVPTTDVYVVGVWEGPQEYDITDDITITIKDQKDVYNNGDTVTINIHVDNNLGTTMKNLSIELPNGETLSIDEIDENGFDYNFGYTISTSAGSEVKEERLIFTIDNAEADGYELSYSNKQLYYDVANFAFSINNIGESGESLTGGVFELYRESDDQLISTGTEFSNLGLENYYIKQSEVASGYLLYGDEIKIIVDGNTLKLDNYSNTSFDSNTNVTTINVVNTRINLLPNTGGAGNIPFVIFGVVFILVSVIGFVYFTKRKVGQS